jgi:AGZA family xanthine/uracil permease-like MFS transporter
MDKGAVFVATCLAAAFGSALMGLYANYPVALAPGMGLNAYFTYSVVKGLGVPWQAALGAVFVSGVLFLLVSVTPVRAWIIDGISKSLKLAISVGIGFFLAIIGLQSAGLIAADPVTLVKIGDLRSPGTAIAVAAFILMAALDAARCARHPDRHPRRLRRRARPRAQHLTASPRCRPPSPRCCSRWIWRACSIFRWRPSC